MSDPTPRLSTLPPRGPVVGAVLCWAFFVLAACSQVSAVTATGGENAKNGKDAPPVAQYPDIPIPKGAKRNIDKTVVVGSQTWFGQLSLDTSYSADSMFDFYQRELPNFGWRKLTSVRAPTSVLSYDREDRVLTIAIQPNRIRGSEVTVTVSPREHETPPPAAPMGAMPAIPPPPQQR